MPSDERVDALNQWCQCIRLDPEKLASQLEDLRAGSHRQVRESMPNAFSNGPVFVGQEQVASIRDVIRAIHELGKCDAYRAATLANAPPTAKAGNGAHGVFFGYDFHLTEDGPKLIEINTNAGGAMLNLALGRAQAALCSAVEPLMKPPHDETVLEDAIVAMFQEEARAARHPHLRRIAVVDRDPPSQFMYPELLLFVGLFKRHGIEGRIVRPEDLVSNSGVLTHRGDVIDLVYNRLTDFYLESPRAAAVREAWTTGRTVVTPNPRAYALFADKRNLELLSSSDQLREIGAAERTVELLTRAVPPTRRVRPQDAGELWARRKHLFFKPATGFGSRGAYAGGKMTRKVFDAVLAGDYIAQELVPPSKRVVNVDGNALSLKVDIRAYTYKSDVLMFNARVYRGQVTNLRTLGGGFAPLYVLPAQP